eukprot:6183122-Pleurochrysis_carterae.AAC.1
MFLMFMRYLQCRLPYGREAWAFAAMNLTDVSHEGSISSPSKNSLTAGRRIACGSAGRRQHLINSALDYSAPTSYLGSRDGTEIFHATRLFSPASQRIIASASTSLTASSNLDPTEALIECAPQGSLDSSQSRTLLPQAPKVPTVGVRQMRLIVVGVKR